MAKAMDIAKIWSRGQHEGFTPYMVAKLINVELAARELDTIIPQMMYNYDRNGQINGVKGQNQSRGYTTDEVVAFIDKFVNMRTNKAAKAKATVANVPSSFTVEDVQDAAEYLSETNPTLI